MKVKVLHRGIKFNKISEIKIRNHIIYTPIFIPAISSVKSGVGSYKAIINFIQATKPQIYLVSAYDLKIGDCSFLNQNSDKSIIVLDSGGFEILNSQYSKPWSLKSYIKIIRKIQPDWLMSFDNSNISIQKQMDQLNKLRSIFTTNISIYEFVLSKNYLRRFIPSKISSHFQLKKIKEIINTIECDIIGIPETCLGNTRKDKVSNVRKISKYLSKLDKNILFHILGCGDPQLIIDLHNSGGDIFDGTSWYRKMISKNRKYKLSNSQEPQEDCLCKICSKYKNYNGFDKLLAHNLELYTEFMNKLEDQTFTNEIQEDQ